MSDQVEIVAAEDAPSDTENGEMLASAQSVAEQPEATSAEVTSPEATTVESESQTAPVAATEAETLVGGPDGEVSDVEKKEAVAETAVEASAAAEESTEDTSAAEATTAETDSNEDSDDDKAKVRILAVGQQVEGTVKRIADFGAFVDIGVGRDGLIHISELSVRRVGKVTDVLTEGQAVTAWIKKLDRDRNRISLTLIDPNTKTIRDLNKDDLVQGTVTRILPYGAFVDIGIGRDALLHVREMGVGYVAKPEDVVKVGDTIESRIIELSRRRGRVDLSLKGLRDEPEPSPVAQTDMSRYQQPNARRPQEPEYNEPEAVDDFEELEVLSPMELAFKRAMEAEGMELNVSRKKQNKRGRREGNRSLQDEIVARTLNSGRK